MLVEGKLSAGHAPRAGHGGPQAPDSAGEPDGAAGLVGAPAGAHLRPAGQGGEPQAQDPAAIAQFTQLEGMARELFGTRVKLDGDANNGKITLYYYNADDLQRIWDVLEMANEGN